MRGEMTAPLLVLFYYFISTNRYRYLRTEVFPVLHINVHFVQRAVLGCFFDPLDPGSGSRMEEIQIQDP
jgi:hypothetical protein